MNLEADNTPLFPYPSQDLQTLDTMSAITTTEASFCYSSDKDDDDYEETFSLYTRGYSLERDVGQEACISTFSIHIGPKSSSTVESLEKLVEI